MKEFQEEMQKENLKLIEMESGIDEKLLNRFTNLRNSRQTSVVPVKNNICTGCNMRVPTYLNKILKSKEEVIFCESCGRILYYTENLVE
jgi:predicted  nucleic acid-binding Zn-ribbon protein